MIVYFIGGLFECVYSYVVIGAQVSWFQFY